MARAGTVKTTVRPIVLEDALVVGEIMASAFNEVFQRHGFAPPFPSVEAGKRLVALYAVYPEAQGFVAERNGRIVGSGFLHVRGDRAGIGPVTVDASAQGSGAGRAIMYRLLEESRQCSSVRLTQDAFNNVSFSLYSKLGFVPRDVLLPLAAEDPRPQPMANAAKVRLMTADDLDEVAALDTRVTGWARRCDFDLLLGFGPHLVCERAGRMVGYLCRMALDGVDYLGPAAAEEPDDLKSLLYQAAQMPGARAARISLHASQPELVQYAMDSGYAVTHLSIYMVRGDWQPPNGVCAIAHFPEAV
jgi:GNAT superfamily N-acetyltransferase